MRIFRSVRFNIFLGLCLAIASATGMFLPQRPEVPEKVAAFLASRPGTGRLLDFLGLFDLYHAWWFMGLLGLMAFDIVLCKLWNKPTDPGLVALPPEVGSAPGLERHLARKAAALASKPYQATWSSDLPPAEALSAALGALRAAGYHIREEFHGSSGSAYVATRHRLQRWGSYTAHIALVVILLGALVKGVFGFVEMVPVLEGGSRPMQNKPDWEVYVDRFTVRYYEGTPTPKSFSSALRVQRGDEVLGAKTIFVNDPLDVQGVRFYQASWGAGGMFRSVKLRIGQRELDVPQRRKTSIPGTPFQVEADVLLPNFAPVNGIADTASLDLKNPAVRFVFHVGPHRTSPLWLFQNDPALCLVEDEQGGLSRAPEPPFRLASIDPVLFSGVQVAYDPGFPVVVGGSLLWLWGTVTLFYLHRRRLWLLVEPAPPGGSCLAVGGWSSRGPRHFESEFQALMRGLRERTASRDDYQTCRNPLTEVS